jgi:hypothetical protein
MAKDAITHANCPVLTVPASPNRDARRLPSRSHYAKPAVVA